MLLPVPLRLPVLIAFAQWLTEPLLFIKDKLTAFISYANNELAHGSSVIELEKYLNDRFDADLRRIKVLDGLEEEYPYFRKYSEETTAVFRTYAEGGSTVLRTYPERYNYTDFIVQLDNTIGGFSPDLNELSACVAVRKLAGMQFSIEVIIN